MEIDGHKDFLFINSKGKPKVAIDYTTLFVRMVKKYNKHHKDRLLPHITPHTPYILHKTGKQEHEPKKIYSISWAFKYQYHNELVCSCP